jgi:2-methylcitrate dehydratase PrpD
MGITAEVARFIATTKLTDIPAQVQEMAKGFILDGVGVTLAGTTEKGNRIIRDHVKDLGGKPEAQLLGTRMRAPVRLAAFANAAAGHAMDYDDTQLSTSKESTYGLLTHPTLPVLCAAMPLGEKLGVSGRAILHAYIVGVEVECRIADAINPAHYREGFHSTATMGGFGGVAAASILLKLREETILRALGIVASMAAGLRENFGTMTKPFHAGRAAENGVVAADLARRGFTAAPDILEAKRGFFNATARGFDASKISGRLGNPYFFKEPGISIKPYPSGSLSHPAQDLILDLVKTHDLKPDQIERIEVGTNSDIPNALIHTSPVTALQAKFSIPFCMAIAVLERKAGIRQFVDRKVRDPKTVELMKRVTLYVDDEMERLGFDRARAIVKVTLKDGRVLRERSDAARGMPEKPLGKEGLEEKFFDCAALVMKKPQARKAADLIWTLDKVANVRALVKELRAA